MRRQALAGVGLLSRNPGRGRSPGMAAAAGRMNLSTALAKPSSVLEVVTRRAVRCTSRLALPIAMLSPEWANISTSLGMSPIVAMACGGIAYAADR